MTDERSGDTPRLAPRLLGTLVGADVPSYDRSAPPKVVHLGVGAFAQAHLAVYADDMLRAGTAATIHGVSLRSHGAERRLAPQSGLFAVLEREPGPPRRPRIVGSLTRVDTGADAAVTAIAGPCVEMLTLTVTEKAYDHDEAGAVDSAVDVLVRGLAQRRRLGLNAPIVASLDNLADNGAVLRAAALGVAASDDVALARWIDEEVRFPSSVVDRMVPATDGADRAEATRILGVRDEAVVVAEQHRSWAIERVDGLLPFDEVGVDVVDDLEPYQIRKLWLLNGPHSALAYLGRLAGCVTIAEAATHPVISAFVAPLVDDVIAVMPGALGALPARAFADEALRRFKNPDLGHTCRQVGADGSRKLRQRLVPSALLRLTEGLPLERHALVLAAWLASIDELDDPDQESILAAPTDAGRVAAALSDVPAPLRSETLRQLGRLRERGPEVLVGAT